MDLENDDNEIPSTVASSSGATTLMVGNESAGANKINSADKNALNLANGSVYLNSLLTGQIPGINPAFMFFPNAAGNQQTAANNLLESTTMMAVAMQQMQQFGAYGNGALTDTTAAAAAAMGGGDVSKLGQVNSGTDAVTPQQPIKEIIKTKSCILFPPNPSAPPPTIRDRPPGCRTVFVGGLPEQMTEEILREIFESCGEISTLRMSKKNFCHIRFRQEESIDRAIYLSGYRLRLNSTSTDQTTTFARLHVDYAQARDDQYDYQCKQRQLQREQRHRERMSLDRLRSQSPPPIPHYSDHEASLVAESLRSNDTFIKGVQTLTVWLERGDCNKRNANVFYSMIQSTHAHVRRLTADKQVLEEDLRKARESFRKQMLAMAAQFTQIDKVFNAASHKNQKVWDHFTKAQRKNIDQWKKLATELRSIQIDDDEMEMSDEDRDYQTSSSAKRRRFDSDNLKEENDSLRCQLEAMRNEMSLERTDLKYNSDFREKQMKVLQETIRNMQTQLLQTKMREQKDAKHIEMLEKRLKEAGVKQLLLKTKIKETNEKLRDAMGEVKKYDNSEVIDIDVDKNEDEENDDDDDEVKILEISDVTNEIIKEKPGDKIVETSSTVEEKSGQEVLNKAEEKQPEELKVETKSPSLLEDAKIIALATAYLLIQPMGSFASDI
ncbi:ecto-NOX disulfide-thiol exchanger 2-like, partial [Musca vetustissima]|uniref:ecto-NOX disulfide-thiol exchanger 2-like n=1 Tax=Musca vetustissima TaxID=27455 RepID=UPI002AB5EE40